MCLSVLHLTGVYCQMVCYCGRTVLEPPIPCGTRISCSYPCSRPVPPCGHPKTTHTCHEDPTPCPPCPFLTTKTCTCGKKAIQNIRCGFRDIFHFDMATNTMLKMFSGKSLLWDDVRKVSAHYSTTHLLFWFFSQVSWLWVPSLRATMSWRWMRSL